MNVGTPKDRYVFTEVISQVFIQLFTSLAESGTVDPAAWCGLDCCVARSGIAMAEGRTESRTSAARLPNTTGGRSRSDSRAASAAASSKPEAHC